MESSSEYNGTQTNARSCYFEFGTFGVNCEGSGIIAPTPVTATVRPELFNVLRPHNISQMELKPSRVKYNCGYKKVSEICSNSSSEDIKEKYEVGQFNPGFNDITR